MFKTTRYFLVRKFLFVIFACGVFLPQATAQIDTVSFVSQHVKQTVKALVVTPNNTTHKTPQKYPTIILLHGHSGSYISWSRLVNLQQLANTHQFVFICPDGLKDSWYINAKLKPQYNYYSFLVEDFLPTIRQYTCVDSTQLFVDGYSMGGHGAIYLYLRNPKSFKAAGSISGVLDLQCSAYKNTSVKRLLGTYNQELWKPYVAIEQLQQKLSHKPMVISCGINDRLVHCNRTFKKAAENLGFRIHYLETSGKHNGAYWSKTLPAHLLYFKQYCF